MGAQVSREPPLPNGGSSAYHRVAGFVGRVVGTEEESANAASTLLTLGYSFPSDYDNLEVDEIAEIEQHLLAAGMCIGYVGRLMRAIRPPLPLPGGYVVAEQVYFTGTTETFENGDRVEHGKQGEVMGPATSESCKGKGVDVRFPGNKGVISCWLTTVRRRRRRAATRSSPAAPPSSPSHTTSAVWAHR